MTKIGYNGFMSTTANVLTLLKFYANKQKSPMINYDEFADYIRRYAQHHMEENSDLVKFMGNSSNVLDSEINLLAADHQVVISQISGKDFIFVVASYVENFANIYKRIEANVAIPFPNFNDISKHVPHDIATPVPAADIIYKLLDLGHPEENIAVSSLLAYRSLSV